MKKNPMRRRVLAALAMTDVAADWLMQVGVGKKPIREFRRIYGYLKDVDLRLKEIGKEHVTIENYAKKLPGYAEYPADISQPITDKDIIELFGSAEPYNPNHIVEEIHAKCTRWSAPPAQDEASQRWYRAATIILNEVLSLPPAEVKEWKGIYSAMSPEDAEYYQNPTDPDLLIEEIRQAGLLVSDEYLPKFVPYKKEDK
ncbi:MAG: hypothetical protein LBJ59_04780 [Zoogloeaceae bacterium]|jgi:hypothetical protein|nr:hypothetical protein [Zoogloeaceae bacterium]